MDGRERRALRSSKNSLDANFCSGAARDCPKPAASIGLVLTLKKANEQARLTK